MARKERAEGDSVVNLISPSSLAVSALGLAPSGSKISDGSEKLSCAMCGVRIGKGMKYDLLELSPSFTNQLSMAIPGGAHICGDCKTVLANGEFLQAFATVLISKDGVFSVMRKENRAAAFLEPPEPPFCISIQNAQQQHMIWRTPVSLSRDLILIRVGEQILRLRRQKLVQAREIVFRLDDLRQNIAISGQSKVAKRAVQEYAESPFVSDAGTWKYTSTKVGVKNFWYSKLEEAGVVTEAEQNLLSSLNPGEAWALQAVLHRFPALPEAKIL